VTALERAEARALALDGAALLARVRRSLRLAGTRRSAPRTRDAGGLTGRQREVLGLVAAGMSNAEIARRLGLGRPTVVQLIRSAQRELGVSTRTQAAALVGRR
jgi:DNA-binding CsgD family transcriptional regulator